MTKQIKQPDGQDRNIFNNFKRVLKNINNLTDEQLAILHYESWHEASMRASGIETSDRES